MIGIVIAFLLGAICGAVLFLWRLNVAKREVVASTAAIVSILLGQETLKSYQGQAPEPQTWGRPDA